MRKTFRDVIKLKQGHGSEESLSRIGYPSVIDPVPLCSEIIKPSPKKAI
jgi:hypothetical protein